MCMCMCRMGVYVRGFVINFIYRFCIYIVYLYKFKICVVLNGIKFWILIELWFYLFNEILRNFFKNLYREWFSNIFLNYF